MKLTQYLLGNVTFSIEGGRCENFLSACAEMGFSLQQVKATALGFTAHVPMRVYPKLRKIAKKYRCRLRLKEKRGAYFALWAYRKRYGMALGFGFCVLLLSVFRGAVWNIRFYDFTLAEEARVRTQLNELGVYEGAVVSNNFLRLSQQQLYAENEMFGWAKLNFVKGRLIVERTRAATPLERVRTEPTNVVASASGLVEYLDVLDGYPLVKKGQYVAEGQTLVSGFGMGITGRPFVVHASAAVYADVLRVYKMEQPLTQAVTLPMGNAVRHTILHLPHVSLALPHGKPVPPNASEQVVFAPVTLFGLHLPATFETHIYRETQEIIAVHDHAQALAIARQKVYDTLAAEFPGYELRTREETQEWREDTLFFSMTVHIKADIAKIVQYAEP